MSCSSGGCSTGGGCSTKSSTGGCSSGGCSSGGCNKLNSFDWLGNMELDTLPAFDMVEVRFKNGRKEFFRNTKNLELYNGDPIVIEMPSGHHIGYVSLQGEIVRLQMKKKNVLNNDDIKAIYRKASVKDLEKFEQARNRESGCLYRTREIINQMNLGMKLSDVEFQADNTKVTFFYSADDRVDFRELIKLLAAEYKVRIEMKQISLRHEAGRLGGIGSCGRELCCSTWLTDFKNVNTSAARYQNLSLNPSKLSGQCGRLKCCLNYELDTYLDALKDIPDVEIPLKTAKGDATLQKTDIFKKIMWFGFQEESNWLPLPVERVVEIIEMNKAGIIPATLLSNEEEVKDERHLIREKEELSRFDDKFSKKKKKKKKRSSDGNTENTQQQRSRPTIPNADEDTSGTAAPRPQQPQRTPNNANVPRQNAQQGGNTGNNNANRNPRQNNQGGNSNQGGKQGNNNPRNTNQRPKQNNNQQTNTNQQKPANTETPATPHKHTLNKVPKPKPEEGGTNSDATPGTERKSFPQRQNNTEGTNPSEN